MRWPQIHLRTTLLAIALVAINTALLRFWSLNDRAPRAHAVLGSPVAFNVLCFAMIRRVTDYQIDQSRDEFWTNFIYTGWFALIVQSAVYFPLGDEPARHVINAMGFVSERIVEPVLATLDSSSLPSWAQYSLALVLVGTYLTCVFSGPVFAFAATAVSRRTTRTDPTIAEITTV